MKIGLADNIMTRQAEANLSFMFQGDEKFQSYTFHRKRDQIRKSRDTLNKLIDQLSSANDFKELQLAEIFPQLQTINNKLHNLFIDLDLICQEYE